MIAVEFTEPAELKALLSNEVTSPAYPRAVERCELALRVEEGTGGDHAGDDEEAA